MRIRPASLPDLDEAAACLAAAFEGDPLTRFLMDDGSRYRERVERFFSLLMRARIELEMPALVGESDTGICGAVMGYTTERPAWPADVQEEWSRFERAVPGLTERLALYEGLAQRFAPAEPHYYLGVIGVDPRQRGIGLGKELIASFCDRSAGDRRSNAVYLETANPANLKFYERAGFVESGRGDLGGATLWCLCHRHDRRQRDRG